MGAQTYFANISNSLHWSRPEWEFEYDTREAYSVRPRGGAKAGDAEANVDGTVKPGIPWPSKAPLNATFWHLVTEEMLNDTQSVSTSSSASSRDSDTTSPLLDLYKTYEAKSSSSNFRRGGEATSPEQKVCYIRAGSGALGSRCRERFGADNRGVREQAFGIV